MECSGLKPLAIFFLLSFCSHTVTAGDPKIFKITSNVTLQRMWENVRDIGEEKRPALSLYDILHAYLRSPDDEIIQSSEMKAKIEISNLKDAYINTCDAQIMLQNVNYRDFNAFQSSPVQVETKIAEVSHYRTIQIIGSVETSVMTLSGEMIFKDSNYSFSANLTNPVFRVEKNISHKITFDSSPSSEGRLESFTYEEFTINVHPKDMFSVTLKKHELKTSILLRLADTWLPHIADSINTLLSPKMQQHEKLLTENSNNRKLFIKNVCNLMRQQNDTKISSPDSIFSFSLIGLSNFKHCEGDAMVAKKFGSSEVYDLRHNVSILLNYNNANLLIKKEEVSSYPTTVAPYTNIRELYRWQIGPTTSLPKISNPGLHICKEIYIKRIDATFAFEVDDKRKINRFTKTDLDFIANEYSMIGCSYSSVINEIKFVLNKELEKYLNSVSLLI